MLVCIVLIVTCTALYSSLLYQRRPFEMDSRTRSILFWLEAGERSPLFLSQYSPNLYHFSSRHFTEAHTIREMFHILVVELIFTRHFLITPFTLLSHTSSKLYYGHYTVRVCFCFVLYCSSLLPFFSITLCFFYLIHLWGDFDIRNNNICVFNRSFILNPY